MLNKRGITPLVATVLLIAFSIGLGALVMSWGEEYIEQKATFAQGTAEVKSECDLAKIDIIKISGQSQACSTTDTIQIWLDNGPDIELTNIHARIAGTRDVQVQPDVLAEPLLKSNAEKITIPYSNSIGAIQQVKLTPKIWTGKQEVQCTQSAITVERLLPC